MAWKKRSTPEICAIGLAAAALIVMPGAAWSFGAGIGCSDLPEYDRAVGVLQGIPSACDMSVERAKQIVAAQDGQSQPAAPRVHHRRHRTR